MAMKTTMISDLKDSKVSILISKSFLDNEANFLQNPDDYRQVINNL
jgi:hypothetical protein